jgi:predicted outer membrane repeat protein
MRRKVMTALMAGTLIGLAALAGPPPTSATEDTFYISVDTITVGGSCTDPDVNYNPVNGLEPSLLAVYGNEDFGTGDTIILCDNGVGIDYVFESNTPSQDIASKEITITGESGQEVVLDANGFDPFIFANGTLNIENLVIQDAGTAITMSGTPTLNVTDVTFEDGADVGDMTGQSIDSSGIVSVVGSTFTHNYSSGSGGAIYLSNAVSVTISDSVFGNPNDDTFGNFASDDGGDIYVSGGAGLATLSISNSQFHDAYVYGDGGSIAAICAESVISGITISGAQSDENGAGLYLDDDSGCGADYTVTVSNSRFLDTDADDQGGAISNGQDGDGPLTEVIVSGGYFYQNEADSGAAINLDYTNLTVSNSTFIENHARDDGGGAFELYDNENVVITGSRFDGNTSVGSSGGVIQQNGSVDSLRLVGNTFTQNTTEGSGGVIYAHYTESLTIESNVFQRNTAGSQGGAIRVRRGTSGTSITGNTFTGNSAEQGGAVSINDGEVDSYLWSVSRNTFTKNRATLNGGALHMALDDSGNVVTPNVKKNRFRGNSAPAAGAVVVESDYGTGRAILKRYERGLRGNSFQANRGTSDRRSANIGVHFD